MRLLSWNIHKGIGGMDRRYDLQRVLAVVAHYDPDVAILQEVDRDAPRSRRHDQAVLIAQVLDYPHIVYGANVQLTSGCYGNATLSRFPIAQSVNIDLSYGLKKPRGALYTEVHARSGQRAFTLHLINLHLGLSGIERRWQARRLLGTETLRRLDGASRVVVGGDTNDWNGALWRGPFKKAGFSCATGTGRRASLTFPAWQPVSALDRVFFRGALTAVRHFRGRLRITQLASDHIPVIVDLALHER